MIAKTAESHFIMSNDREKRQNPKFVLIRYVSVYENRISPGQKTFFTTKKVPEDSIWDFPGTKNVFYYKKSPGGLCLGLSRDKKRFLLQIKSRRTDVWDF